MNNGALDLDNNILNYNNITTHVEGLLQKYIVNIIALLSGGQVN